MYFVKQILEVSLDKTLGDRLNDAFDRSFSETMNRELCQLSVTTDVDTNDQAAYKCTISTSDDRHTSKENCDTLRYRQ